MLQCAAVHCSVLWCVAARNGPGTDSHSGFSVYVCCCSVLLQCVSVRCSMLRMLQRVAACRIVLQCIAVCCSVLRHIAARNGPGTESHLGFSVYVCCCSVLLQCVVAVCCSVLQRVAVCCSALQLKVSLVQKSSGVLGLRVLLQRVVAACCCSVLNCVAVCCCSVLQLDTALYMP